MTTEVGNIVISHLVGLPFIDKMAGVVKTLTKTDMNSDNVPVRKTFPIACDMNYSECINNGKYKDLIPNSSNKCIVYLEDSGLRFIGIDGPRYKFTAGYRLVCWINQKKLGFVNECSLSSKIMMSVMNRFPDLPQSNGIYQQLGISVIGQDPKSYNPFSKYSYDEDKTQYLLRPYDYFSLQLEADFKIDKRCIVEFEEQAAINCNNEFN